jgi:hypothetical protein
MPFFKYILAALLGSNVIAAPGAAPEGPSTRALTADAITQPGGGTEGLVGQNRHHKKPANRKGARKYPRLAPRRPINPYTGNVGGTKRSANQQPQPRRPRAAPSKTNKNSK